MDQIPFHINYNGKEYQGWLKPVDAKEPSLVFHVVIDFSFYGTLVYSNGWHFDSNRTQKLAEPFGDFVATWWQ